MKVIYCQNRPAPWRIIVPARLTGTGRRQCRFFKTEEEAKNAIEIVCEREQLSVEIESNTTAVLVAIQKLSHAEKYKIFNALKSGFKSNGESSIRYRENVQYRIRTCLSNRLAELVRFRKAHGGNILKIIGCDIPWLTAWFEVHFLPGMTWGNYGKVWHIDHKRPCKSFDLTNESQQKACFHWTNLQPLFAKENLNKGSKELIDRCALYLPPLRRSQVFNPARPKSSAVKVA